MHDPLPQPPEQTPPHETPPAAEASSAPRQPYAAAAAGASFARWLREGLRATALRLPRLQHEQPSARQLLLAVVLASLAMLGLERLEIPGPAEFHLRGWLLHAWSLPALLFLAWWAVRPGALAAWFVLWTIATLPIEMLGQALSIARAYERLPAALSGDEWPAWVLYFAFVVWLLAVAYRIAEHGGATRARRTVLVLGLLGLSAISLWVPPDRRWTAGFELAAERAQLQLSQETFEEQQALWERTVEALAPEWPGTTDVYGLVFAPYADEDVFLRESTMVADVLRKRFDADGRVLHLVNHPETAETHPWATPLNLQRAIAALAERMDRENDLLVVYLTSHGASDFQLAATHGPLQVEPLQPQLLRAALDEAGIRHRVIAVSACYSGGWVAPLAGERTLVMTAADATHTSYGCGRLSELTFFGRAVFDEQLRRTHSFEEAFAAAVPVIRRREDEAGKQDGFSNPQISVGEGIRPLLARLQERLGAPAR